MVSDNIPTSRHHGAPKHGDAEVEAKIAGHDAVAPSRAEAAPLTFTTLDGDLRAVWTAPTTMLGSRNASSAP
jgi:hypothetical protein